MSDLDQINVVLGYGCHLNARVRGYLEQAAAVIKEQAPSSSLVITSGGFTALRSAPGVSEAKLMAEHLRALGVTVQIELEENARTTVENIRNVARLIEERGWTPRRVLIFGDRIRRSKVHALARYFLKTHAVSVEPCELQRTFAQTIVQTTIAVPFDGLVARVRLIERISLMVIERRMRRS